MKTRNYDGPERRTSITMSEEEVDEFIDRAIERAVDRFYAEVGKSVLKKLLWVVGATIVGLYFTAKHKGWL